MKNYFETPVKEKLSISQKISNQFHLNKKSNDTFLKESDRSFSIQKIFDLHMKKDYKVETLFIAAGIFDRYINMIGYQCFPRE